VGSKSVKWMTMLALPVLLYVGLSALMYFTQRGMVYFPQFTRVPASETDFALDRPDATLRGWAVNHGQRDAVLYFGGNAESIQGMRGQLGEWFPGHSSYLLAYRGYGASDGAPREELLLADALALFDHVRTQHPEGDISVIGRSLGSGVASYLASQRDVHRLVLVTPFDSLVGVGKAHYPWLPVGWLATERYESDRYLADHQGPVLILRAGRDEVVPPANTDRLIASLPVQPLVLIAPDADHNSQLGEFDQGKALGNFVSR